MWDLIVSVPDHCLSFFFVDITNRTMFLHHKTAMFDDHQLTGRGSRPICKIRTIFRLLLSHFCPIFVSFLEPLLVLRKQIPVSFDHYLF